MRPDLLVGRRKGIEPAAQLEETARSRPARELAAHVRRVDRAGQEQSRLKDRFVASPEKALLDLVYLQPEGDTPAYLRELRLQNLARLDLDELGRLAERAKSPKLRRATTYITEMARAEALEYETL